MSILNCLTSSGTNLLKNISLPAFVRFFAVSIDTGTPMILGVARGNLMFIPSTSFYKTIIHSVCLALCMGGERQTKRSCPLCQHEERDRLESGLADGSIEPRLLDKDMGWRTNTTERHVRNHMGSYSDSANHTCIVCTSDNRRAYEVAYFEDETTTEEIAAELDCSEELVYRHMKNHFQPLVKRSATAVVAVKVGEEVDILRNNVQTLNGKLAQYMDETSLHDDGVISDMVKLHKEVRETLKDLHKFQETWSEPNKAVANNTINILKVELGKESPETWKRVKEKLLSQADGELDENILDVI